MSSTKAVADNVRVLAASMVEKANSGHPGGPMGGADFVSVLYAEYLNYDPDDMTWFGRDRFYLDAGHMSAMLYGIQAILGNYSIEEMKMSFTQLSFPATNANRYEGFGYGSSQIISCRLFARLFSFTTLPFESKTG